MPSCRFLVSHVSTTRWGLRTFYFVFELVLELPNRNRQSKCFRLILQLLFFIRVKQYTYPFIEFLYRFIPLEVAFMCTRFRLSMLWFISSFVKITFQPTLFPVSSNSCTSRRVSLLLFCLTREVLILRSWAILSFLDFMDFIDHSRFSYVYNCASVSSELSNASRFYAWCA